MKVKKGVLEWSFGSSALRSGVAHLSLKDHCMSMLCMYLSCLCYTLKINPIGERKHLNTILMIAIFPRHSSNAVPSTYHKSRSVSASSWKEHPRTVRIHHMCLALTIEKEKAWNNFYLARTCCPFTFHDPDSKLLRDYTDCVRQHRGQ